MRIFLAITLPKCEELDLIRKKLKGEGVKITHDNHITLIFFGEKKEEEVREIEKKLHMVEGFGPFKIELTGIGFFPNSTRPRVVWVGVKSKRIYDLYRLLEQIFDHADKEFVPHLTLARIKRPRKIDLGNIKIRAEFNVDRIHLIKSTLTPNGPIYEIIRTVRL